MSIPWGTYFIQVTVTARTPKAARRHVMTLLYRQISQALSVVADATLAHEDGHVNPVLDFSNWFIRMRNVTRLETYEQRLGSVIRMHRLEIGLNQAACAEQAEMSRQQLSEIERGKCVANPMTLFRLEKILSVPLVERPDLEERAVREKFDAIDEACVGMGMAREHLTRQPDSYGRPPTWPNPTT